MERGSNARESAVMRPEWRQAIERHRDTGRPQGVYFHDDPESFGEFLKVLGYDTVQGAQILAYKYCNTVEGITEGELSPSVEGSFGLMDFINHLADTHGLMLEFPNNFKVGVIVEHDEDLVITYHYELDEQPGVCAECEAERRRDEDYQDDYHSCGHSEDTYSSMIYGVISRRPSKKELEDYYSWHLA